METPNPVKSLLKTATIIPEYGLKIGAVSTGLSSAASANESFFGKMGDGLSNIVSLPWDIIDTGLLVGAMLKDARVLTVVDYTAKYGRDAGSLVVDKAQGIADVIGGLYTNFSPIASFNFDWNMAEAVTAGAITGGLLYGASRAVKVARQDGKGSKLHQAESYFWQKGKDLVHRLRH